MPAQRLIVIGGGEHARVVIEAARSRPGLWSVLGFVDPEPCSETCARLGVERLGGDDALAAYPDALAVIGFGAAGEARARAAAVSRAAKHVRGWATVVHASAVVSASARLEPGAVVMAGAIVQTGATLGAHSVVNTGAVIEHDVQLGSFSQVAPGAVLGGRCAIGDGAYVGLGASVRDHVSIGANAMIGMGAVVVRDVPPGVTVKGVPAR